MSETETVPEGPTDPRFTVTQADDQTTVISQAGFGAPPAAAVPPAPSSPPASSSPPAPSGPPGPPVEPPGGRVYSAGESYAPGPERGRTTIADDVVERTIGRIVDLAADDVAGVHGLHTGSGDQVDRPVTVQLEGDRATIDIAIEVEFGYPLHEVVQNVRDTVIDQSERLLGLTVAEVNVLVAEVVLDPAR